MRPGGDPFRALGRALIPLLEPTLDEVDRLSKGNKLGDGLRERDVGLEETVDRLLEKSSGSTYLLLIVDQFEELFRETEEKYRATFVDGLFRGEESSRLRTVLTLRADFYEQALELSRGLADALEAGLVNLGPLTDAERDRVVRKPAERVQLEFEPGLPEVILRELGHGRGQLPLLEFCLQEIWRERSLSMLTHDGYESNGRVEGALARRADRAMRSLAEELHEPARKLFTEHLIRIAEDDDAGRDTRRRAKLVDLTEEQRQIVTAFSTPDLRLLVTAERWRSSMKRSSRTGRHCGNGLREAGTGPC